VRDVEPNREHFIHSAGVKMKRTMLEISVSKSSRTGAFVVIATVLARCISPRPKDCKVACSISGLPTYCPNGKLRRLSFSWPFQYETQQTRRQLTVTVSICMQVSSVVKLSHHPIHLHCLDSNHLKPARIPLPRISGSDLLPLLNSWVFTTGYGIPHFAFCSRRFRLHCHNIASSRPWEPGLHPTFGDWQSFRSPVVYTPSTSIRLSCALAQGVMVDCVTVIPASAFARCFLKLDDRLTMCRRAEPEVRLK